MKLLNNLLIILVVFCSLSATVTNIYAANDSKVTYKNQRGSIMTLNFHPNKNTNEGTLDGTVTLAAKQDAGAVFPLFGYYNGNAMAITINFSHSKQVTAMAGHFLDNKNKIQTLSLDALQTKDPHTEDWNSNVIRAGSYTRFQ